jgi:hypothetical protein
MVDVVWRGTHAVVCSGVLNIAESSFVHDHELGRANEKNDSCHATPYQASQHTITC